MSEFAESSAKVLDKSLESSSTVLSSMRRGERNSSRETARCCCFEAISRVICKVLPSGS